MARCTEGRILAGVKPCNPKPETLNTPLRATLDMRESPTQDQPLASLL